MPNIIEEFEEAANYDDSREEPAKFLPTLVQQPSNVKAEDVEEKLADAVAEINRLRALLAEMPQPSSRSTIVEPQDLLVTEILSTSNLFSALS